MIFLADTNVLSELRKRQRRDKGVQGWIQSVGWSALSTSWIVIGELRRGANLVRRRDPEQADALDVWIDYVLDTLGPQIYPIDGPVAEAWAQLGVPDPLPTSDGLIAATAIVHDLTLATRNIRDFAGVGLKIVDPWAFQP